MRAGEPAHRGRHLLLLEAGGEPDGFWISIPAGFGKLLTRPDYNWRFETEPEQTTHNRVIASPRGKGWRIDADQRHDLGTRPAGRLRQLGAGRCARLVLARVEPLFRRIENYMAGEGMPRQGRPAVEKVRDRWSLTEAFVQAAKRPDKNAIRLQRRHQEGFGYYQANQRNGRRWSAYDAYLKPGARVRTSKCAPARMSSTSPSKAMAAPGALLPRPCGDRETGVVTAAPKSSWQAGAVQTPQILELAGIGRPTLLRGTLGIPVRHALPRVWEATTSTMPARA